MPVLKASGHVVAGRLVGSLFHCLRVALKLILWLMFTIKVVSLLDCSVCFILLLGRRIHTNTIEVLWDT